MGQETAPRFQDGSEGPQDGPKTAQHGPKTAPRQLKRGSAEWRKPLNQSLTLFSKSLPKSKALLETVLKKVSKGGVVAGDRFEN